MEHTWESHHRAKLALGDEAGGDVAVCGLATAPDRILAELGAERVAFVAPLTRRAELEWLLRGLQGHARVSHLVLCGEDRGTESAALVALLAEGLDASARLPGPRGRLCPDLDRDAVDALREHVALWDWRDQPLADVARRIRELPRSRARREPCAPAAIAIPERKRFPSRQTTFPLFAGDVGDGWLQLLNLVLRIGTDKTTARGERIAETLNAVATIELSDEEEEVAPFLDFAGDDLDAHHRRFVARLRSAEARTQRGEPAGGWDGFAPLEAALERLGDPAGARSGTLVFVDAERMRAPADAPPLLSASLDVVDGKLFGSFVLRSSDVYTEWPLDAFCLTRLQREAAARLGLGVGSASFVVHSARLHEGDWERAQRVLDEAFKRPLPLQVDPSGIFLFGNDGGKARAMLLDHDAGVIFWEGAFSDPEDLSWYIIDVMPWLLPQHVRYVGQECAALMRAIREGECYEQG